MGPETQTQPQPEKKPQTLAEIILSKVHKFKWYKHGLNGDFYAHPKRMTLIVSKGDFVQFQDEMDEPLEALIIPGIRAAIERALETKKEVKIESVKQLAESL